jgi:hypothetical protein
VLQVHSEECAHKPKIIFGTLFSLDQFTSKLQGKKEKGLASFCVFHTKNYKVQTLAATSIVIILFTEPTFPDIKCRLSRCSQVFNEYKSRNVTLHEKGGSQRIISRVLEQDLTQVLTSN